MMKKNSVTGVTPAGMIGAIVLGLAIWPGHQAVQAQSSTPALRGVVTSAREGAMEGVLVNARRDNATFTVSVVNRCFRRVQFPQRQAVSAVRFVCQQCANSAKQGETGKY